MDNKTETRKNGINKIIPATLLLMLLVSFGYLLAGNIIMVNDSGVSSYDCDTLNNSFEVVHDDGSTENITLPAVYEQYEEESELILRTPLTNDMSHEWLMIWNMGHEIEVYVGDELRLAVNNEGRRLLNGAVAYQYDFVDLSEADGGKQLSIHYIKYPSENHQLGGVYIGDKASLLLNAIRPYQVGIWLAEFMVIVGMVTAVIVRFCTTDKIRARGLFYMSLGAAVASMWFLLNSPAAQFIFPNIETARDCAFFFASMIALPLLMYVEKLLKGRYAKLIAVFKIASVVSFAVLVIGYFVFGISLNTLFIPTEITAVSALGTVFAVISADFTSRRIREYYIAAIGFIGFIAFALIYVIMFLLYPYKGDSGILMMVGIIQMYVTSILSYRKNKLKG
ncbi:MAG: hypothetical protein IKP31_01145 [Lachnospiraceae bacterium]|nr:hypothetical protein [Lachnospiraceae bacterium]